MQKRNNETKQKENEGVYIIVIFVCLYSKEQVENCQCLLNKPISI